MNDRDPIKEIERLLRDVHDTAGKHTQPVLRKYPLVFAFLLVFSIASILHGFDLFVDQTKVLHDHPLFLVGIGLIILILTGTLYEALNKMK